MPTLAGKRRSLESTKASTRKKVGVKRVVPSPLTRGNLDLKKLNEAIKSIGKTKDLSKDIATENVTLLRKIVSVPVVNISVGGHARRVRVSRKPAIDHWVVARINKATGPDAPILKKK